MMLRGHKPFLPKGSLKHGLNLNASPAPNLRFSQPVRTIADLPCAYSTTMAIFSPDEQLVVTGVCTGSAKDETGATGAVAIFDKSSGEVRDLLGCSCTLVPIARPFVPDGSPLFTHRSFVCSLCVSWVCPATSPRWPGTLASTRSLRAQVVDADVVLPCLCYGISSLFLSSPQCAICSFAPSPRPPQAGHNPGDVRPELQ